MAPEVKEALSESCRILAQGGLILYPTDTVWGVGCDATNVEAVQKVYRLKQREDSKALICLMANQAMLERHVATVPEVAYDILDLSTKPTTIIYDRPKGIAENLIAADDSLAIRIPTDIFSKYLVGRFGKPIVSTSANLSGQATPRSFAEIPGAILTGVDYVVPLYHDKKNGPPSTIIKLGNDGTVKIIRE